MRSLIFPAVAAALTTAIMALPAQAETHRHHRHAAPNFEGAYGAAGPVVGPAYGTMGPQLTPLPNGYVRGTDPDANVREDLARDPPNDR
jgi:hypothetical protein